MPTITAENRDAWQALASDAAAQYPSVGKTVSIQQGKYKGASGRVTWHGPDQYTSTRYMDSAMLLLRQLTGREGYRIRIQSSTGEAFFCKAEYAEILHTTGSL